MGEDPDVALTFHASLRVAMSFTEVFECLKLASRTFDQARVFHRFRLARRLLIASCEADDEIRSPVQLNGDSRDE